MGSNLFQTFRSVAKFFRSNLLETNMNTWLGPSGYVRTMGTSFDFPIMMDEGPSRRGQPSVPPRFFSGTLQGEAWSSGPVVPTHRATWGQQSFGQLRPCPRCSSPRHPRWSGGESSNKIPEVVYIRRMFKGRFAGTLWNRY